MKRHPFGSLRFFIRSSVPGLYSRGRCVLFLLLLLSGVVCGAICSRSADIGFLNRLDVILQTNFKLRSSQGLFMSFVASLASSAMLLGMLFLFGLSLWGVAFAVAVPFFKGYGYGLSAGFLYRMYGFTGFAYNIMVILPGTLISALAITAAAMHASESSRRLMLTASEVSFSLQLPEKPKRFSVYILRCLAVCTVGASVDMLFSFFFSWIFHF